MAETGSIPAPPDASTEAPQDETAEGNGLRLSFSRVDTYQTCPLKFRFAYLDKLPSAPSPDLSWGSSIHAALEAWWDQKLPEPPPVESLWQALYDHWDDTGFEAMEREEKLKWYNHARTVLAQHHQRYAPSYQPAVAVEEWFELDLGDDVVVVGSIDHVARTPEGGIGIVDWKTNRKAKNRQQVAKSLQLAIYAIAARELWGQDPEWVALDFVVPGVRVTVPMAEIDTEGALKAVRDTAALVRQELFEPTPSALCPWCDFRTLCPAFEGEGPDVAGTALVELRKLRRKHTRDAERITQLEQLVRDRLGPDALLDLN